VKEIKYDHEQWNKDGSDPRTAGWRKRNGSSSPSEVRMGLCHLCQEDHTYGQPCEAVWRELEAGGDARA
jgi:hypothetical protein